MTQRQARGEQSSVRIIAGQWKGRRLKLVAAGIRPTPDRIRETLFNWLAPVIEGRRGVDLFAGTGALGIEALSRGAARVSFVDDGMTARALIRANVERARAKDVTDLWRRDATRLGPVPDRPFGMIFLDPPYGKGLGEQTLDRLREGNWLARGAIVVFERGANEADIATPGYARLDQRTYGAAEVLFLRHEGD